jgi:hypothetical protein
LPTPPEFNDEETYYLLKGVQRYGEHRIASILRTNKFPNMTADDLRAKWQVFKFQINAAKAQGFSFPETLDILVKQYREKLKIRESESKEGSEPIELIYTNEEGVPVSELCPDFGPHKIHREHHPTIAFKQDDASESEGPDEPAMYDNQTKDPFQKVVDASRKAPAFKHTTPVMNEIRPKKPQHIPAVQGLRRYNSCLSSLGDSLLPTRREVKI